MNTIDVSHRQTAQSSLLPFSGVVLWSNFEFGLESEGVPCWMCDFAPWFGGFDEILKIIKSAEKMARRRKMKKRHTEVGLASLPEPRPVGGQQAMSEAPHPTRCVGIGHSWRPWDMIFKMMAEPPIKKGVSKWRRKSTIPPASRKSLGKRELDQQAIKDLCRPQHWLLLILPASRKLLVRLSWFWWFWDLGIISMILIKFHRNSCRCEFGI